MTPLSSALCDAYLAEVAAKAATEQLRAKAVGVPVRTAYAWREKGMKLSVEFMDEIDDVPENDRIYLHFMHSIEQAKGQNVVWALGKARRLVEPTTDALEFLEYICPEEYGPTARRPAIAPEEHNLNRDNVRILSEMNARQDAREAEYQRTVTSRAKSFTAEASRGSSGILDSNASTSDW